MTIIGFGKIGKRYTAVFAKGFDVCVSSSRDVVEQTNESGACQVTDFQEAIASSDYIFLAVPIHALDSVISMVNKYVNPNAWAFDMCSARIEAGTKMDLLNCRWFGLHAGYVIGDASDEILSYLSEKGNIFVPATAEEHDKQNSIVALIQFIGMAMDSLLSESERQFLKKESPASTNLLKLIDHLKANSPDTYRESQIQNKFTKHQRHRLLEVFREYSDLLDQGYFPFEERLYNKKLK